MVDVAGGDDGGFGRQRLFLRVADEVGGVFDDVEVSEADHRERQDREGITADFGELFAFFGVAGGEQQGAHDDVVAAVDHRCRSRDAQRPRAASDRSALRYHRVQPHHPTGLRLGG